MENIELDSVLDQLIQKSIAEFQFLEQQLVKTVASSQTIFDIFVKNCLDYHEQPAHSLAELRTVKSTKAKGDLFELFCSRFLKKRYLNVWLLKELTEELKKQLKLPLNRADYGIDVVCEAKDGCYSAVQCKFKAPSKPRNISFRKKDGDVVSKVFYPCVNWSEIATFNSLCEASGPWKQRITMTTAPSVRRLGGVKNAADQSICCGTFRGLSVQCWQELLSKNDKVTENKVANNKRPASVLTLEELRAKRCRYFDERKKNSEEEEEEKAEEEKEEQEEEMDQEK